MSEPKTTQNRPWSDYKSPYLPGDLVMTIYGLGVVEGAGNSGGGSYSVKPLPGSVSTWRTKRWGWMPFKSAWYENQELALIKKGLLSQLRDSNNNLENMGLSQSDELEATRQKLILENPEDDDDNT